MKAIVNNNTHNINSTYELSHLLDYIDNLQYAEVWFDHNESPSICLLKSNDNTFLMYLENSDDEGVVTKGSNNFEQSIDYKLTNGQIDQYPQSWCIEKELAYKGLAYFYENEGAKSPYLNWHKV